LYVSSGEEEKKEETQSAHLHLDADRKTKHQLLPAFDRRKSFRSIIRQPSRRKTLDHLTVTWHPAPKSVLQGLDTELSEHTEHSERKDKEEKKSLISQNTTKDQN